MMATFKKRFHSRNHAEGQLIQASELVELQQLQYQTYCNIEADRYGLNPDGSFTPHVISGLTPSIVAGQQQIKIGRGHGWITNSLSNTDERVPIILEEDLYVDIPAGDATHPSWCHVLLENLTAGKNVTYGPGTVGVKDVNGVITPQTVNLYMQKVTTTAVLSEGTPAASPECNVIVVPNQLPIATVYIPAGFSGEVDAANLYDVRWFAPGHGQIGYTKLLGETAFTKTRTWISAQEVDAPLEGVGGLPYGIVAIPNNLIFALLPTSYPILTAMGADTTGAAGRLMGGNIVITTNALTHPLKTFTYAVGSFKYDGSGADLTTDCAREIGISFNPVI